MLLHGLTRLYHLGLEGNRISVLEENIFKDLKSLTYLDLDGNGIREVSDEAFNGLTALKYLSLSGNPLFPLNTLYKLNALTSLYINYNSYRTLSPEHFEQLASLQTVYADNPYFCDCSLRWTSVVSQYSLTFQTAYCLEPGKVYKTAITSASLYTNCTTDESYNCFSKTATCPTDYVCRDTASSYACTCADGFSLLSTGECLDENECEQGKSKCEYLCNNTIGSYECSCDTGYQLSGNDISCEDVDECATGIAQCMSDETCVNTVGNYACRESGCVQSCENPQDHSCTCCDGFRLYNNSQCIDIDECIESIDECDMNCHNNKGSYACSCLSGYQLVNETKCIDIDECLVENGGCDDLCMNIVGSYTCPSNETESCTCPSNEVVAILSVIIVLLAIVLLILLTVVTIVFSIMFARRKMNAYQSVFHPNTKKDHEPIYDFPNPENSTYDDVSETSAEVYPSPNAAVQLIN